MDARRKQLIFRSHHCGIRENDILLGRFADSCIERLNDRQLDQFDALMGQNDIDVMNWIIGKTALPEAFDTEVMKLIKEFNKTRPLHKARDMARDFN